MNVTGTEVRHTANNGIQSINCGDVTLTRCTVHNIGMQEGMGGDLANGDYEGVHSLYRDNGATFTMQYCDIDSIGYNGLSVQGLLQSEGPVMIYRNNAQHTNYQLTDGGIFYVNLDTAGVSTPYTKLIRGNYLGESWGNKAFNTGGQVMSVGMYFDNQTWNYQIDSNTVYKANRSMWPNESQRRMKILDNTLVHFEENAGGSSEQVGSYWATLEGYWLGGTMAPYKSELQRNIIVGDDDLDMGVYWYYDGPYNDYDCVIDYNTYHNGFTPSNYMAASRMWNVWTETYYTLANWRTFSGFDINSTFNANSWKFSNVTGITADQFVWLFRNRSGSAKVFSLGSAVFKDIAGATVSGTVSVPKYGSRVLFYSSGSLSGVDNPFYNP